MPKWLHNAKQSNWWRTIKGAWARWTEEDGDQRAAAFAYYLLLSLLPLVFILVSAGSLFVEREVATREVVQWIEQYVPLTGEQERGVVENIQGVLEFPLLLWGALKFLRTLIRTTNRIWHSHAYSWWRLPLKSLGLLGVTLSTALLGILLPGIARLARSWLASYLEFPGWAFALLFNILPWLVLFCGVMMIYRLAPSRATKFSEVWIAALVATGLIWACEWLFLLYAVNFADFNVVYGALGGVAALLLWIYLSSCIGVFGICLCAAQAEIRGRDNLTNHSNGAIHE
jgi:Ca2+-transporting ATPase